MNYLIIIFALLISQISISATAFKCVNDKGLTIFTDVKCSPKSRLYVIESTTIIQSVKPRTVRNIKRVNDKSSISNALNVIDKNTKYLKSLKREESTLLSDLDRRTLPYGKTRGQLLARLRYIEREIKRISDFLYHYKNENNMKGTTGFTLGK